MMVTADQLALLRDKIELWSLRAERGLPDFRDYDQRCAEALKALLADWEASDPAPWRDALHELVMCHSEQQAIGGGPGWQRRDAKAWRAAEELFEP
jgi:hypothetical protein